MAHAVGFAGCGCKGKGSCGNGADSFKDGNRSKLSVIFE
jgi:hypothetical protein